MPPAKQLKVLYTPPLGDTFQDRTVSGGINVAYFYCKEIVVIVKVARRHIRHGKLYSGDECPVALALREHGHLVSLQFAFDELLAVDQNGISTRLPRSAYRFGMNFNDEKPVKPFSFKFSR